MLEEKNYQKALEKLKPKLQEMQLEKMSLKGSKGINIKDILANEDEVLKKYGGIFSKEHIQRLTEEEFISFLSYKNNHHWTNIHRQGPKICADMEKLRIALKNLFDEDDPKNAIYKRYDKIIGTNRKEGIPGMGKATITAVLLVAFPNKYGVWNGISEDALEKLNILPKFERGETKGKKYEKINNKLLKLASDLKIDLWTLDALWWFIMRDSPL